MKNILKQPIKLFVVLIGIILAVIIAVYIILFSMSNNNRHSTIGDVFLYEPDYDAQIMTEEEYLILDRSVRYSDGIGDWPISDPNGVYTSDTVQLFLIDYIDDLVRGDASSLRAKYSKQVLDELNIPTRITQQRVYETKFTEISKKEITEKGETFFRYEFRAEYKIMRNDGTFRPDLASDSIKGQYLTIEMRRDSVMITQVVEYAVK